MSNTTQDRNHTGNNNGDFKQYLGFDKRFGYLHELREVPDSNPKVYSARIAVPQGQGKHINYVNLELYVKSAEALLLFFDHIEAINDDDTRVTLRFSCSNVYPKAYIGQSGSRAGEAIAYLSGNLSHVFSMKVNGQFVFGERNPQATANGTGSSDEETMENLVEEAEQSLAEEKGKSGEKSGKRKAA